MNYINAVTEIFGGRTQSLVLFLTPNISMAKYERSAFKDLDVVIDSTK